MLIVTDLVSLRDTSFSLFSNGSPSLIIDSSNMTEKIVDSVMLSNKCNVNEMKNKPMNKKKTNKILWRSRQLSYSSINATSTKWKTHNPHSFMSDPTSTIYFHNMSCGLSNKILFKQKWKTNQWIRKKNNKNIMTLKKTQLFGPINL